MGAWVTRRVFVRGISSAGALAWLPCTLACTSEAGTGLDAALDDGAGCPPFLTPTEDFFVQFGGRRTVMDWSMPDLSSDSTISLEGLLESPLSLGLSDLEADREGHVTVLNTMMCVLGSRGTATWTGVPLRRWLERAGVDRERARRVRFFGADGFENNLKLSDIDDNPPDLFEPLLAFRIGAEPLPRELGYPVRLLLGDRYGFKNIKWLTRIEVTDSDEATGQYQALGYEDAGVIETVPTVESHRVTQSIPAGPTEVCGFALSGHAPIETVEVGRDDNPAEAADLISLPTLRDRYPQLAMAMRLTEETANLPRGVWVPWHYRFDASPGEHRLHVRTRDAVGNLGEATTLTLTAT